MCPHCGTRISAPTARSSAAAALLGLAVACVGNKDLQPLYGASTVTDVDTDTDTDADSDTDTDTDADSDADTDTDPTGETGTTPTGDTGSTTGVDYGSPPTTGDTGTP